VSLFELNKFYEAYFSRNAKIKDHPCFLERQAHYQSLQEYNLKFLKSLVKKNLFRKITCGCLSKAEAESINAKVEAKLFKVLPDVYAFLKKGQTKEVRGFINEFLSSFFETAELAQALIDIGYVLLIVRPEMFHVSNLIKSFLESNGFTIAYYKESTISLKQYLCLYEHAFGQPVKEAHVRRRMFGYINKPVMFIVFNSIDFNSGLGLSEYFTANLKGKAAHFEANTLRGELIFREMSVARDTEDARLALDPLMQYELLDDSIYTYGIENKFLVNLQGIHFPEPQEVLKDFYVMFDRKTLNLILKKEL